MFLHYFFFFFPFSITLESADLTPRELLSIYNAAGRARDGGDRDGTDASARARVLPGPDSRSPGKGEPKRPRRSGAGGHLGDVTAREAVPDSELHITTPSLRSHPAGVLRCSVCRGACGAGRGAAPSPSTFPAASSELEKPSSWPRPAPSLQHGEPDSLHGGNKLKPPTFILIFAFSILVSLSLLLGCRPAGGSGSRCERT